jgi:hypothetical protein
MAPDWMRFLVAGQEKVIGHYRRLMASSIHAEEREMLQRRMFRHERELLELLGQETTQPSKAA